MVSMGCRSSGEAEGDNEVGWPAETGWETGKSSAIGISLGISDAADDKGVAPLGAETAGGSTGAGGATNAGAGAEGTTTAGAGAASGDEAGVAAGRVTGGPDMKSVLANAALLVTGGDGLASGGFVPPGAWTGSPALPVVGRVGAVTLGLLAGSAAAGAGLLARATAAGAGLLAGAGAAMAGLLTDATAAGPGLLASAGAGLLADVGADATALGGGADAGTDAAGLLAGTPVGLPAGAGGDALGLAAGGLILRGGSAGLSPDPSTPLVGWPKREGMGSGGGAAMPKMVLFALAVPGSMALPVAGQVRVSGLCCFPQ
jgi:hypothetical protein